MKSLRLVSAGFPCLLAALALALPAHAADLVDGTRDGYVPSYIYGNGVSGDFDGDGLGDMASTRTDGWGGTPRLYFSDGAGLTAGFDLTGEGGWKVWRGDVNGDGIDDLVHAASYSGTVGVLEGSASARSATTFSYTFSGSAHLLGVFDWNGDGRDDLVFNTGRVFMSQASTGRPSTSVSASFTMPVSTVLGAGDFNGDGKTDFLGTTSAGWPTTTYSLIEVTNTSATSTTASVTSRTLVATATSNGTILANGKVAVGDIDGDGYDDAVVTGYPTAAQRAAAPSTYASGAYQAVVYYGSPTGLVASDVLLPGSLYTVGSYYQRWFGSYAVTLGDVTGDGELDLSVTDGHFVYLYENAGGGFGSTSDQIVAGRTTSPGVYPETVGYWGGLPDIDGNGSADLAYYQNNAVLSWWLGPEVVSDSDGDGYDDDVDAFPNDASEWADTDGDGVGDNGDAFPDDASESADTDGDGVGDNADRFPTDAGESADTDGDGVGDNADGCDAQDARGWDLNGDGCLDDTDLDGATDDVDVCPSGDDFADGDGDLAPDACDACPTDALNDQDGDGLCASEDLCPLDYLGADDDDGDSYCNSEDRCAEGDDGLDADTDAIADACDLCPADAYNDADADGICGDVDTCVGDDRVDADADGLPDACDLLCPLDPTNDADFDGVCGGDDACPLDALDDQDGDGSCDSLDICPGADDFVDTDGDGAVDCQDACDLDVENDGDGDGLCESDDNCEGVANPEQADADGDGIGNACEPDSDADGLVDDVDNCDFAANPSQADLDRDGQGDACDTDDDGDGVSDAADTCAATPAGTPALNATGCSVDQTCPTTAAWKNHGAYVSCVSGAASTLVTEGDLTTAQKDALVSAAARSSVGKPTRR